MKKLLSILITVICCMAGYLLIFNSNNHKLDKQEKKIKKNSTMNLENQKYFFVRYKKSSRSISGQKLKNTQKQKKVNLADKTSNSKHLKNNGTKEVLKSGDGFSNIIDDLKRYKSPKGKYQFSPSDLKVKLINELPEVIKSVHNKTIYKNQDNILVFKGKVVLNTDYHHGLGGVSVVAYSEKNTYISHTSNDGNFKLFIPGESQIQILLTKKGYKEKRILISDLANEGELTKTFRLFKSNVNEEYKVSGEIINTENNNSKDNYKICVKSVFDIKNKIINCRKDVKKFQFTLTANNYQFIIYQGDKVVSKASRQINDNVTNWDIYLINDSKLENQDVQITFVDALQPYLNLSGGFVSYKEKASLDLDQKSIDDNNDGIVEISIKPNQEYVFVIDGFKGYQKQIVNLFPKKGFNTVYLMPNDLRRNKFKLLNFPKILLRKLKVIYYVNEVSFLDLTKDNILQVVAPLDSTVYFKSNKKIIKQIKINHKNNFEHLIDYNDL